MDVLVPWMMLRELPTSVKLPFQALVDDGLLADERLTLALLYAYSDEYGFVDETPRTLAVPRALHKNSVRRHLYKLEALKYLVPIRKASKLAIPQHKFSDGYALTLRPDGERFEVATGNARIGSKHWQSKTRWS